MTNFDVPMRKRLLAGAVAGVALTFNPWTVSSDLKVVVNSAFAVSDTGVAHAAAQASTGLGIAAAAGSGSGSGGGSGSGSGGGGSGGGGADRKSVV